MENESGQKIQMKVIKLCSFWAGDIKSDPNSSFFSFFTHHEQQKSCDANHMTEHLQYFAHVSTHAAALSDICSFGQCNSCKPSAAGAANTRSCNLQLYDNLVDVDCLLNT
jgi:hypothetical protein